MKRRSFFSILTGVLGLSVANKMIDLSSSNHNFGNNHSATYIHKYRSPEELKMLYGENVSENLEKVRSQFFENKKLLSLKKFSEIVMGANKLEILIELRFDSVLSKEEYLAERGKILKNSHNKLSINKV